MMGVLSIALIGMLHHLTQRNSQSETTLAWWNSENKMRFHAVVLP
jgi:hypothetical protein